MTACAAHGGDVNAFGHGAATSKDLSRRREGAKPDKEDKEADSKWKTSVVPIPPTVLFLIRLRAFARGIYLLIS
jgi:hypothetical protein